ncbi:MAG: LysM peptidoglycan-binding domain-containing protein [Herpetosiphonaceae bacterium]|nr:LysM peptidoglycan-binding domain-containing protein [Herpetosiphonaceae bacterium]
MLRSRRLRSWLMAAALSLGCFLPLPLFAHSAAASELAQQDATCTTSVMHMIQVGETLSGLAVQFGIPEATIIQANGLADPNLIYGGQPLLIPNCGFLPAAPAAVAAPAATMVAGQHVVQAGETIWSISLQYGISQDAIARANSITNPGLIYAGQSLVIPAATPAPAPAVAVSAPVTTPAPASAPAAVLPPAGAPAAKPPVASVPASTPAPATSATKPTPIGKRIEVNLSTQQMYAYDGNQLFVSSGVSTGRPGWDTPPGNYAVYEKLSIQTMRGTAKGTSWVVPNVPNVMYFFGGDALHGTYWHNRFGTGDRLSHGCVNLPLGVAAQLYAWAPVGTPVWVHY